jgi:hypothetical protein
MRIGFIAAVTVVIGAPGVPVRPNTVLATTLLSASSVFHTTQEVLDERLVARFLRELQRALARDDRQAVAAQVQYPLIVLAGGIRIPIADAAALIQTYDLVFSPVLKAMLAEAAIPTQRLAPRYTVAVSGDAAIVGPDLIRIQAVGAVLKITRISPPLAAPAPAAPGERRSSGSAVSREPRRLALQIGQVQLAGALAPGARDAYVVSAAKNQLLEVRINGVSGRDIVARIVNMKSRTPLDARARDGVRTWSGRVPDAADYRIDVVRLVSAGEPRLPYVIVVSMR